MGKVRHSPGDVWHLPEGKFAYVMETEDAHLVLERIGGKGTILRTEAALEALKSRRKARRERPNLNARGAIQRTDAADEIGPEGASDHARSLAFFTREWDKAPSAKSSVALERFVAERAEEARRRGIAWMPSAGALRRAISDRGEMGMRPTRVMQDQRGKTPRVRWSADMQAAMTRTVAWFYALRSRDYSDAYGYLFRFVKKLNERGRRRYGLSWRDEKTPSYETLRRRIRAAEDLHRLTAKLSSHEARRRMLGTVRGMEAKGILDVVMIDATTLDGWCVLDDRHGRVIPVGRPTVNIAIDVYSRVILGVVITYEGESLYAVMACLQQVVTGKHLIAERLPQYAELLEDLYGLPETLVVDNAWRQTGVSFEDACADVAISVEWAPVRNPEYKSYVESFWKTLNKLLIHKLPGAVPHGADLMRKLGLDPKATATLTLSALEDLIYRAIYDVYHGRPHSGTMLAPLVAWRGGLAKGREVLDDVDFLAAAMGTVDDATLDRQGIRFKGCRFHDPETTTWLLADLASTTPVRGRRGRTGSAKARVKIKFNPADLTQIQVWNPKAQPRARYVSLPNWDTAYASQPGLGFWHHKQVQTWAETQNLAFRTDEERVLARDGLRAATENAAPEAKIASVRRADNHRQDDWITAQAAASRFGIDRKMLGKLADDLGARRVEGATRSPVLFPVEAIERLAAVRKDLMPASAAAIRLGLPSAAVAALAQAGMIRRIEGAVLRMVVGDVYYARSSVEALVTDLLERTRTGTEPRSGGIRLSKAAKRLGGGQQPWPAILAAIVDGDLPAYLVPGVNAALTTEIGMFGMRDLVRIVAAAGAPPPLDAAGDDRVNRSEAAALLGTHEPMVGALVAHGLLPRSGHAYCSLRRTDIEAFRASYVLGGELARAMGVRKRDVRGALEARGVTPVASVMPKGGLVWRRETVTALLKIC